MIDKNTFCSAIKEIIKVNEALDELQDANPGMTMAVIEEYSLQDTLISVLEQSMNLPVDEFGSTISWWIYDTKFGKDEPYLWLGKKRTEKNKITLDTVEKLYDWCVKEGEQKCLIMEIQIIELKIVLFVVKNFVLNHHLKLLVHQDALL